MTATDAGTNEAIDEAVASANSVVTRRIRTDVAEPWPSEVHTAALILGARTLKRRASPEGVAGFGDFGLVRVSAVDGDVETMLGPYLRLAFA